MYKRKRRRHRERPCSWCSRLRKGDQETAQQAYDRSYEKHGDKAKVPAGYEKDEEDPEKIVPKGTADKNKKARNKQAKQDKKDLDADDVTPEYKKKIRDRQQKDKVKSMPKTASDVKNSFEPEEDMTTNESIELQAIMALDDAGIKADINRKGQVVVKKKDKKKAHKAIEKSFPKGGWPAMRFEDVDLEEASSKKARN